MTTKKTTSLLAMILASLVGTAYAVEEIKLGFSAPLTGPQAAYGKDLENGMLLAIEEFNASKPKINGQEVRAKLFVEDDQGEARLGPLIAQRMIDRGVKGVFGHYNSSVAIPASRVYQQAGVPQLSGSTAPDFTRQGFNTTYRIVPSDIQQGGALARFAVKNLGLKTVVVIDDRTAYGQGVADEFDKAARAAGAKILRREFTSDKAHDFKAILTNIKRLHPQAIFYGGMATQAAPLVKQMRELGITATLLGGETLRVGSFLKVAGHAAQGTVAALGGRPLEKMPGGLAFKRRYEKRFGVPTDVLSPYIYDATTAMLTAMRKANSTDPNQYRAHLSSLEMAGVTNSKFAYNTQGDLRDSTVTIYKMSGNGWQVVETLSDSYQSQFAARH